MSAENPDSADPSSADPSQSIEFLAPGPLLGRYGLSAKKAWGQNFLHDQGSVRKIVRAVNIEPGDTVVEIGAGLGSLTSLLARRASRLVAIERDRDLIAVLRQELGHLEHVQLEEANALTYDFAQFSPAAKVVGNLPYHISSPLIFHLLEHRQGIASLTIMLQKELADRLTAPSGNRLYGSPTVTVGNVAEIFHCFKVNRGAFTPPPNVDSAVIQLRFRPQALFTDTDFFEKVVRGAFSSRRKMVKSALSKNFDRKLVDAALERAGLSGDIRAEKIDLDGFVALARELAISEG